MDKEVFLVLDYKLKIALIPERRWLADAATRKGIFAPKYAIENKNKIVKYIKENFTDEKTTFTDLEWLNDEGLLSENSDVDVVKEWLIKEKVDAIFIINCNFGNEEAAGQIAKKMNLPTLLWGPQDFSFDGELGMRYTDCQCGLFAISKQLKRLHVPFSYIPNCAVEDKVFAEGLTKFFSVATMVKNFRNLKITLVGTRLNPFKSVMYNELELTEKFGLNLQNVNMAQAADIFGKILEEKKDALEKDLIRLKEQYDCADLSDEVLTKMLAFVYMYIQIFENTGSDVLASECWTSMPLAVGANPCLAMSILYDMGYIVTCESDIHGAVTQALLMCASRGEVKPLFGEFTVKHPTNPNAELLWHCGPFPLSMKAEGQKPCLFNTKPSFRVKDGIYTLARFQGDEGKYTLFGEKIKTCDGPNTFGTYLWAEFDDFAKTEKKFIYGPYIHHMSELYGDYTEILEDFCRYIPCLEYDTTR